MKSTKKFYIYAVPLVTQAARRLRRLPGATLFPSLLTKQGSIRLMWKQRYSPCAGKRVFLARKKATTSLLRSRAGSGLATPPERCEKRITRRGDGKRKLLQSVGGRQELVGGGPSESKDRRGLGMQSKSMLLLLGSTRQPSCAGYRFSCVPSFPEPENEDIAPPPRAAPPNTMQVHCGDTCLAPRPSPLYVLMRDCRRPLPHMASERSGYKEFGPAVKWIKLGRRKTAEPTGENTGEKS